MHETILQFIVFAVQKISEEHLKELRVCDNALCQVVVVRSDECVTKIPGMLSEGLVVDLIAKRVQIFDDEHRSRARVAFGEGMDLLDAGSKPSDVVGDLLHRQTLVREAPFDAEVIINGILYCVP